MSSSVEALIIGSGAGGSVTARRLAEAGVQVLVIEEGQRPQPSDYGTSPPKGLRTFYRRNGMNPILGKVPIGFAEGRCLGGGTEVNSGFWHRTPGEVLERWAQRDGLRETSLDELTPHLQWCEAELDVGPYPRKWPRSTQILSDGAEALGWKHAEVHRVASSCRSNNTCASGCPTGAKRSMSTTFLPKAEQAGAQIMTNCRVLTLLKQGQRVRGITAIHRKEDGTEQLVTMQAENIFVCAGPAESAALLRRSGIGRYAGETFRIHPMLKVAARFAEPVNAQDSVLPLIQVSEFKPEITLGGAFYSPGHLATTLAENWQDNCSLMESSHRMATYYVAVRGNGRGRIRSSLLGNRSTSIRYDVSAQDLQHLSQGLAHLSKLLLAAGAEAVYPAVQGLDPIKGDDQASRWLNEPLPG